MIRRNETAYMPVGDDHPQATGAGIVKVIIIALSLLLVGRRFGLMLSLLHFAYAIVLATMLYFLWRGLRRHLARRWQ